MEIRSNIDSAFLDFAKEEIYQILLYQHLSHSDRWNSNYLSVKVIPFIRVLGFALSVFGILLSLYVIWRTPEWCPAWININHYLFAFIVLAILFYFLPKFNNAVFNWSRNYAHKNCKKIAGKCVKEARNQVPFIAEYVVKGNSVIYCREKDGESKLAWIRKLKGVAIYGQHATVIFRKWSSFNPKIILLHEDFDSLAPALRNIPVETRVMRFYENSSWNR